MKSLIDQKIKEIRLGNSSEAFKREYKMKTLDSVLEDLGNKKNRYIFYCPDIVLVNSLVKLVYETAYELHKDGYDVVILHEMNGFKSKWLYENAAFKHLKDIPVDYIIKKKGAKTKRTSSQYAFKPADTLIVPDQFVEVFENLIDVKLLQKVLLVTSYTSISAMQPGTTFQTLGIDKVLFTDKKLLQDYNTLFPDLDGYLVDLYPINKDLFTGRKETEVLPLISISQIGNNDFVQQVINIFYNKYPNLRVFNFRLLDRQSIDIYMENLKRAALVLVLDKSISSMQMIYEAIQMGCPIGTNKRTEIEEGLLENLYLGDTPFEIADSLAFFCQTWLTNQTKTIDDNVKALKNVDVHTYDNFNKQVVELAELLREKRTNFFTKIKNSAPNVTTGS